MQLKKFQTYVDALVGRNYFEFTMELWNPPNEFQLNPVDENDAT